MKHLQVVLPIFVLLAFAVASSHAYIFGVTYTSISAATDAEVEKYSNTSLFFLEKDMYPGNTMDSLHYTSTATSPTTSFPNSHRREAISSVVPFAISADNLPDILSYFSLDPNSEESEALKVFIAACEMPAYDGETKFCAASAASMVESSRAAVGSRHVRALPTKVSSSSAAAKPLQQQYTITSASRLMSSDGRVDEEDSLVACHPLKLGGVDSIFYCHKIRSTKGYRIRMVGNDDGTEVETVAMCHADTKGWNPESLAFKLLALQKGIHLEPKSDSLAVCHFVGRDDVVWAAKY